MNDKIFNQKFYSGEFDKIFDELSDVNFKYLGTPFADRTQIDDYNALWLKLFQDGETETVQKFRKQWEAKIKEKENHQLSLKDFYLRQAKEISDEKLKLFVSKWDDITDEEMDMRNEYLFKSMILNRLGKNNVSKWFDNPFHNMYFYHEPYSHTYYRFRKEIISAELKKRKLEVA